MVREEYLNPEYMYKCINKLCRADNWVLYKLEFGQLEYCDLNQPILMQNNHGYNIVYKFTMYKLPDGKVNFGKKGEKRIGEHTYAGKYMVNEYQLNKNLIWKDVFFDIGNECFVEDDGREFNFEPYPPFFSLDNQVYYAVYNQPSVLKQHYCPGRAATSLGQYMKCMELSPQNMLSPIILLYHVTDERSCLRNWVEMLTQEYKYDTQEQANETVVNAIKNDFAGKTLYSMEEWAHGYRPVPLSQTSYKLPVHSKDNPVFYTNNVLELTVPIAKAVNRLANQVTQTLRSVDHAIQMLSRSVFRLMDYALDQVYLNTAAERASLPSHGKRGSIIAWQPPAWVVRNYPSIIDPAMKEEDVLEAHKADIRRANSRVKREIQQLEDLCKEIEGLKHSPVSLNKHLDISNMFKQLESKKIKQLESKTR